MSKSGEIISNARTKEDLTQTELAEKANIDNQTVISRWENGKQLPSNEVARQIIQALDLDEQKIIRFLELDRFQRDLPQLREKYGDVIEHVDLNDRNNGELISSLGSQSYGAPLDNFSSKREGIENLPRELKFIFLQHQEQLIKLYQKIANLIEED